MEARDPNANPWDEYAAEYSQFIAKREQADLERDVILARMLELLGDLPGREALFLGNTVGGCGYWQNRSDDLGVR